MARASSAVRPRALAGAAVFSAELTVESAMLWAGMEMADAAEALGTAAWRVSRKVTPPAATQSITVRPATRRMARLRLRRRTSARVRRRR